MTIVHWPANANDNALISITGRIPDRGCPVVSNLNDRSPPPVTLACENQQILWISARPFESLVDSKKRVLQWVLATILPNTTGLCMDPMIRHATMENVSVSKLNTRRSSFLEYFIKKREYYRKGRYTWNDSLKNFLVKKRHCWYSRRVWRSRYWFKEKYEHSRLFVRQIRQTSIRPLSHTWKIRAESLVQKPIAYYAVNFLNLLCYLLLEHSNQWSC